MCNGCASLAGLVLCFIACFILLVIAPLITMQRTVFAALTDDERVVIRTRRTDALEAIQVVDTRGVVETR